jgi:predicted nucleic acid-binding Zn finger protein
VEPSQPSLEGVHKEEGHGLGVKGDKMKSSVKGSSMAFILAVGGQQLYRLKLVVCSCRF